MSSLPHTLTEGAVSLQAHVRFAAFRNALDGVVNLFALAEGGPPVKVIDFLVQAQQGDHWCFAAVAQAIAAKFGNSSIDQCTIVTRAKGAQCCPPHTNKDVCDKDDHVSKALCLTKVFGRLTDRPFTYDEVKAALQNDRPLVVVVRTPNSQSGHALVIRGFRNAGMKIFVDDPIHGLRWIGISKFTSRYLDNFEWTHTFETVPPSEHNPENCIESAV